MSDQSNGALDALFTRVEAAAFLTELGHKITPARLAGRGSEGTGPPFTKQGRYPVYKESELRQWARSPEAGHKGGRGKRAPKLRAVPPDVAKRLHVRDLATVVREHVELADEFFKSDTPNMMAAARFVRSIELLRRMVR